MFRMNKLMLLAIFATTAVLTIITSFIGTGIFSQQANAAADCSTKSNEKCASTFSGSGICTIHTPSGDVSANKFHAEHNSAGNTNFVCIA